MMQLMERKLVSYVRLMLSQLILQYPHACTAQNPHMPTMKRSNVHLDVLRGTDEILDVTDFMRAYTCSLYHFAPILYHRIWLEAVTDFTHCRERDRAVDGHSRRDGEEAPDVNYCTMGYRSTHFDLAHSCPCVKDCLRPRSLQHKRVRGVRVASRDRFFCVDAYKYDLVD